MTPDPALFNVMLVAAAVGALIGSAVIAVAAAAVTIWLNRRYVRSRTEPLEMTVELHERRIGALEQGRVYSVAGGNEVVR
jgi:hypothetical protein